MSTPGKWILVDETPAEFINKGLPEVGDPIRIDYHEGTTPSAGIAVRVGSLEETTTEYAKAPEYGNDFIFTGEIL